MIQGTLTIQSEAAEVVRARDWISALACKAGISQQEALELQLVLSEACTNAIKHAYGMRKGYPIKLSATIGDDRIRLVIRDFGRKMDLQKYQKPDLGDPPDSGYGIYLMQCLMDEVHFDVSYDEGTELTLVKRRHKSINAPIHPDSDR